MKKLIIGAVAIVAGIAANAASITWSQQTGVYDGKGMPPTGAPVAAGLGAYLFDAGAMNQQAVLTAFLNGTTDFSDDAVSATTTVTGGKMGVLDGDANTTKTETFSAFYAVVDSANKQIFIGSAADALWDDGPKAYTWTAGAAATQDLMASFNEPDTTGSYSSTGWYAASAVPEPTSGLLLLLGVAGLALRRRRA